MTTLDIKHGFESLYKLRYWIDVNKLDWYYFSENPNAIHVLEQNLDKVNWYRLSGNPNAIHLLEQNLDKIDWWSYHTIQMQFRF